MRLFSWTFGWLTITKNPPIGGGHSLPFEEHTKIHQEVVATLGLLRSLAFRISLFRYYSLILAYSLVLFGSLCTIGYLYETRYSKEPRLSKTSCVRLVTSHSEEPRLSKKTMPSIIRYRVAV